MQYFTLERIKSACQHLGSYESKWVLVPLVFAVNGVGEHEAVRIQGKGKAGTDRFFGLYFDGSLIGLQPFGNGGNTLRPRFDDVAVKSSADLVEHQKQKLWASLYSRNGYNVMEDRSLIEGPQISTFRILPSFWDAWKSELDESFRFEELLVWLYAFTGFEDEIKDWEALSIDFQERNLGEDGRFPAGYEARFRIAGDVDWPDELLGARPDDAEFQEALLLSLSAPARDERWLRERLVEWEAEEETTPEELNHVEEVREELEDVLIPENLADPEHFPVSVFHRIASDNYGNPGPQSRINRFLKEEGPEGVARLLRTLDFVLYGDGEVADRIDAALANVDWRVSGLGEALLVKCLAIVNPEDWVPLFVYKSTSGSGKKDILQVLERDLRDADDLSTGEAAVRSNRRLIEVAESIGLEDRWSQMKFLFWLRTVAPGPDGLAAELLVDRAWIEEVAELLDDKGQVIFYGPPGTGKTYIAQRLAEWYASEGEVELVQFHPSYSYEDFVQGYRPALTGDGEVFFKLREGPLMEMAAQAEEATSALVIDEINRGNLAKIFGELYFLLEYRDQKIRLQYGDTFSLPEDLVLIGTMNTADRSIGLIDAALRRRFHFVPMFPDQAPIKGLLSRWLSVNKPEMIELAALVDRVNEMLGDRDFQIGPAYFITEKLSWKWLEKIWRFSVIPYLEEHFFDEPERVAEFELAKLRPAKPEQSDPASQQEENDASGAADADGVAANDA